MKNKKAFTLTEILVAMAVVGVVSSLVIPQLVSDVEKSKTGLYVAKAVEQVELGCQNYLRKDPTIQYTMLSEALTANGIGTRSTDREYELRKHIGLQAFTNDKGLALKGDNNLTLDGTGEDQKMVAYLIDTNGTGVKPNKYGRDKFIFYLNNSCKMVPHGADGLAYRTKCKSGMSDEDAKTCSARLVRDGYKITY